jgi:hypothetical protein
MNPPWLDVSHGHPLAPETLEQYHDENNAFDTNLNLH